MGRPTKNIKNNSVLDKKFEVKEETKEEVENTPVVEEPKEEVKTEVIEEPKEEIKEEPKSVILETKSEEVKSYINERGLDLYKYIDEKIYLRNNGSTPFTLKYFDIEKNVATVFNLIDYNTYKVNINDIINYIDYKQY